MGFMGYNHKIQKLSMGAGGSSCIPNQDICRSSQHQIIHPHFIAKLAALQVTLYT